MFFFLLFFSFVFLITDLYENKSCVNCLYRYGSVSPAPTEPVTDQDLINYGFDQSARTIIRQGISEYKREYPEDRHFQSSSDSNVESASYSSSEVL